MKGIILAAGRGTRLGAATLGVGDEGVGVSKPLIPVFDKPTIYYPLSDFIMAGIKDILIITAPDTVGQFRAALGDGHELGISLSYDTQPEQRGTVDALTIGAPFIGQDDVALIFGDNVFSGGRFHQVLKDTVTTDGATIFACPVPNPEAFGVAEVGPDGIVISLEEKPARPKSNNAVVGLYFYPAEVVGIARQVTPSERGELEITSVNQAFLESGRLKLVTFDDDTRWFDTGNPEALQDAGTFVRAYQERTGRLLGSPEAAAFQAGFIGADRLRSLGERLKKSSYGRSLIELAGNG